MKKLFLTRAFSMTTAVAGTKSTSRLKTQIFIFVIIIIKSCHSNSHSHHHQPSSLSFYHHHHRIASMFSPSIVYNHRIPRRQFRQHTDSDTVTPPWMLLVTLPRLQGGGKWPFTFYYITYILLLLHTITITLHYITYHYIT